MACKKNQPGSPCCGPPCHDGTLCLKVQGCFTNAGEGFDVEIKETVGGAVVASYSSSAAFLGFVDCTTLDGDTAYTITVTRAPRWAPLVYPWHSPCTALAWHIDLTLGMLPADGYVCPCFGYGCWEPVKLPFTMNDGFGDVTLDAPSSITTGGHVLSNSPYQNCATRTAQGATGCCAVVLGPYGIPEITPIGDVETPVLFVLDAQCEMGALPYHDCRAITGPPDPFTGISPTAPVLAEGDCTVDPCFQGFLGAGGNFTPPCSVAPAGPPTVTCLPFRIEQTFNLIGPCTSIYGSSMTLVVTEAP